MGSTGDFLMHELPAPGRTRLQKLIARGFADPTQEEQQVRIIDDHRPAASGRYKVGVFLPTMTKRALVEDMDEYLSGLAREILIAAEQQPIEPHLFVAMQYGADGPEAGAKAVEHILARLRSAFADRAAGIGLVGMTLRGPGKVVSINEMTAAAAARRIEAAVLIDDDVGFSEGCFSSLVGAYLDAPRPVAIGARKIGRAFDTRPSALLHKLKGFTQPAENYPHACCMIVSMEVISPRIPEIYSSDDGFICFRLLDAAAPDPLGQLRLTAQGHCFHWVGGRNTGEITSRIRRMLLHHHLFLSHAAPANARYYLGSILFFGMWPWVPFDRSKGLRRGIIKCVLKYLYALWFAKIGLELIVRAMRKRPLRDINWGGQGSTGSAKPA